MQITVNIQRVDAQIHPASSALATLESTVTDDAVDSLLREIVRLAKGETIGPSPAAVQHRTGRVRIDATGVEMPADGTGHVAVLDHDSGLMWSVTSIGKDGDGMSQSDCAEACTKLDLLGHTDWRLPTRAELAGLVDDTRHEPAIDTALFPGVLPRWHWTSTAVAWSSASAWYVYFSNGVVYSSYHRGNGGFALAVRRAGQ